MQARLGADFSQVPVHADGTARAPVAEVGASAYISDRFQLAGAPLGPSQVPAPGATTRLNQGSAGPPSAAQRVEQALSSPGRPLAPDLASWMGQAFGADFSAVRIHDGPAAAASARAVGASMYTSGTHIVVGDDHPGLGSPAGRRDLAHELYHVKQQAEGPVAGTPAGGGLIISDPADPYERAAQRAADHIATAPRCTDGQAIGHPRHEQVPSSLTESTDFEGVSARIR